MNRFGAMMASTAVLAAVMVASWSTTASADTKAARERAASEIVQAALRLEIKGNNSDRNQSLESALDQVPEYAPAMWHRGFVRRLSQWLRFDEVAEVAADDQRLVAYRRLREKSPDTAQGQLELARWCSKNKLPDRARAHLTRVLEIDPEHAEARRLLGYRKVEGVWLSAEEVKEAAVRAAKVGAALKQWRPKLQAILEGLGHRSQTQRELARERLMAIQDPSAIPALELVLSRHSEDLALLMIQVLDRIEAPEAAPALARQAVFSRWERVREAAAERLKSRDPASYVPMLLSAMVTPIQSRAELYRAPNGRLMYRHAFYREGQSQAELAVLETEYPLTVLGAGPAPSYGIRAALLDDARRQDAAMKAQGREMAVARQNEAIEKFNQRICWVLSAATGQDLPAEPERWWKWWNDYNGVYVPMKKPVRGAYHHDKVEFADPAGPLVPEGQEYRVKPNWPAEPLDGDEPFPGATLEYSDARGNETWNYDGDTYHKDPSGRWTTTYNGGYWFRPAGGTWTCIPRNIYLRHSCLLAGTLVWTESGPRPIEEIEVGDLVLSQNPETGELAYKPVLKTTVRPPARMLKIVFGGKALQCSGGHPFWIAGKGWVFARDLEEGMPLHAVDGVAKVRSVHPTGYEELHNLVVADFHTYFVTEAKILTHDNTIREPATAVVPGLARR